MSRQMGSPLPVYLRPWLNHESAGTGTHDFRMVVRRGGHEGAASMLVRDVDISSRVHQQLGALLVAVLTCRKQRCPSLRILHPSPPPPSMRIVSNCPSQ